MSQQVQTRRSLPRLRRSDSLATIISQGGALPEEQIWDVVDQLLRYLDDLHPQGKCHRCFSLSTIGFDSAGELEIASSDAPLTISELVRLHAPLPSSLRHEYDLVLPPCAGDAAIVLAHAGFGGDGLALDLFQVAVLTIRLMFEVDAEKFLASPCLQETLPPQLARRLCEMLSVSGSNNIRPKQLRLLLPGASETCCNSEPSEAAAHVPAASEQSDETFFAEANPEVATTVSILDEPTPPHIASEIILESVAPVAAPSPIQPLAALPTSDTPPQSSIEQASVPKTVDKSAAWIVGVAVAFLLVATLVAVALYFAR